MRKYNVMSPSGKVGVSYYEYEVALKIYKGNKSHWVGTWMEKLDHVIWIDEETETSGTLRDEQFLRGE